MDRYYIFFCCNKSSREFRSGVTEHDKVRAKAVTEEKKESSLTARAPKRFT